MSGRVAFSGKRVLLVVLTVVLLLVLVSGGLAPSAQQPPPAPLLGYVVGVNILHIIDLSANRVIESITAPFDSPSPGDAEFSLDNTILYVLNSPRRREGEIFPFNVQDRSFGESIKVGGRPNDLEISPAGDLAYLNNFGLREVQIIDLKTNQVKSTIPIDGTPNELALSPDGTKAYVTTFNYDEEPPHTPVPLFVCLRSCAGGGHRRDRLGT